MSVMPLLFNTVITNVSFNSNLLMFNKLKIVHFKFYNYLKNASLFLNILKFYENLNLQSLLYADYFAHEMLF